MVAVEGFQDGDHLFDLRLLRHQCPPPLGLFGGQGRGRGGIRVVIRVVIGGGRNSPAREVGAGLAGDHVDEVKALGLGRLDAGILVGSPGPGAHQPVQLGALAGVGGLFGVGVDQRGER